MMRNFTSFARQHCDARNGLRIIDSLRQMKKQYVARHRCGLYTTNDRGDSRSRQGYAARAGALLVHALHDSAKQFYEHYGFQASSVHPMTLMLRLNSAKP
jgi:hypothetical protein